MFMKILIVTIVLGSFFIFWTKKAKELIPNITELSLSEGEQKAKELIQKITELSLSEEKKQNASADQYQETPKIEKSKTENSPKEKSQYTSPQMPENTKWGKELKIAREQGISFSSDNETLISCPKDIVDVVIPGCVKFIGKDAFYRCRNLKRVIIPDSVVEIGAYAFPSFCKDLSGITIPHRVTKIGVGAFRGVKSVHVAKNNPAFKVDEHGALLDLRHKKILYLPPDFDGAYTIPNWIIEIEKNAFDHCRKLDGVNIPSSVKKIGDRAFFGCFDLAKVTIADGVVEIGEKAFGSGDKLTRVFIPASVEKIGDGAFGNVKSLRIAKDNAAFKIDQYGALLDLNRKKLLYLRPFFRGKYIIPEGITAIGTWAFIERRGLTGVVIPDSVTEIGDFAFARCTMLTKVVLPNNQTVIKHGAFNGCSNLNSVDIPDCVKEIGYRAFGNCTKLKKVSISSDTIILRDAFPVTCRVVIR